MAQAELVSLAALRGARTALELSPAETYARPAPTRLVFADAASRAYEPHFSKLQGQLPAQHLWELDDVVVMGKGLIFANGAVVRENTEGAPVPALLAPLAQIPPRHLRTITEPVLYTSRYGVKNYGHCLTDIVPRIAQVQTLRPDLRLAVHAEFLPSAVEALLELGVRKDKLLFLDERPTRLVHGYYASPNNQHPLCHSPAGLARLRSVLPQLLARHASQVAYLPRKIALLRDDAGTRKLLNREAVGSALQAAGFQLKQTGPMPHADQARLFHHADEIVGTAGAAMANLVYCRPGTRVTLMAPSSMPALYFWDLAAQLHLDLRFVYFPANAPERGIHADLTADVDILMDLCQSQ